MRKHFLLLFLLTLLPLAGWAAWTEKATETNISDGWSIAFFTSVEDVTGAPVGDAVDRASYTGTSVAPYVFLVKGEQFIKSSNFNVEWKDNSGNKITADQIVDVIPGGNYTVTVTGTDYITYGSLPANKKTASFWVTKATATIATTPVVNTAEQDWTGFAINLLSTEATLTDDFNGNAVIQYTIDGGETWAAGMPTAIKAGHYTVSYRVVGNSNINGIPATEITGQAYIKGHDFEASQINNPTAKSDLVFAWDATQGKAVAQELINPASLKTEVQGKGTLMYKVDDTEGWISTIPQRSAAGHYTVSWKVVGDVNYGYNDYTTGTAVNVNIDKATPVINATAKAATSLTYPGDAGAQLALLSAEGTATMGATVKYQIKAPSAGAFGAAVAYDAVKGKNAGEYKIKPVIVESDNYNAVTPADDAELVVTTTIARAQAFTAAPTAIENLKWTNAPQVLIAAGTGTVTGKVLYKLTENAEAPAVSANPTAAATAGWKTAVDAAELKGQNAGNYNVWYQVCDPNYVAVEPTAIGTAAKPVKIAPATVSIIVNNQSRTFDNTGTISDIAAEGRYTVTNAVATAPVTTTNLKYTNEVAGLGDEYKDAKTYEGALTTTAQAVKDLNTGWGNNYEYTIVPGNLTINPRPIYVEAHANLRAKFGEDFDISREYTIKGIEGGIEVNAAATTTTAEVMAKYFTTAPVLTTTASSETLPAVDEYALAFTPGTTSANYTIDLTQPENGYVIGDNKFNVVEDPNHKLVITVKPHTQKYTGVAESWANLEDGVDYVVSGLIAGDVITKKPTFTRSESDKFDVKYTTDPTPVVTGYDLIASGVEVTNREAHYPGGIVYNNSTFTIEPVELTATVNPQTILTTATTPELANAALDQDAWTVKGLVNGEAKTVLDGTLAVNTTTSGTAATGQEQANLGNVNVYGWGIKLSIKAKGNYTLKENTEYGELRVILPTTIELNDAKDMTATLTAANNVTTKSVTFNSRTLKKDTWNTLILPFDIKVRDLSAKLGYAVVDMLDKSNADKNKVIFKIATGTIPANTPFMIKTDDEVNLQGKVFAPGASNDFEKIIYTAATTGEVADAAGNKMTGAYKPQTVNDGEYYMTGSGSWKKYEGTGFNINGERVKFTKASASVSAPVFYIEEGDGTMTVIDGETTSIERISAESLKANDGWYTLNGVKLQSMPTQKGIYINNGKKVVIK